MMNRPSSGYASQKVLHFKEYLDSIRPKSKPRQQHNNPQSICMQISPTHKIEVEHSQNEMLQLQHRYLDLESKYKDLLEKARLRNMEHDRLKEQVKMYQKIHQRDTEQIEKLRCIIGLINRKNAQTQVNEQQIEWNQHLKNSRANKFDQSTEDDIKLKVSAEKFHPKKSRINKSEEWNFLKQDPPVPTLNPKARQSKQSIIRAGSRQSRVRQSRQKTHLHTQNSSKGLLLQYEKELKKAASGVGRKLSNVPYSQLRYVPSFKK